MQKQTNKTYYSFADRKVFSDKEKEATIRFVDAHIHTFDVEYEKKVDEIVDDVQRSSVARPQPVCFGAI